MYKNNLMKFAGLAMLSVVLTSCIQESGLEVGQTDADKSILASIEQSPETRVSIDTDETEETGGSIYYWWSPEDEIGVFTDENENNIRYVNTEQRFEVKAVRFSPEANVEVVGTPTYAYFPYSPNAGDDITAVKGYVPVEQTINEDQTNIPGMYRYGYYKEDSSSEGKHAFGFKHTLSTIRWYLDVSGTELDGRRIHSVEILVKRGSREVPICGDFTFNAATGAYKDGDNTSHKVVINFDGMPTIAEAITFYSSMFPSVKKGDYMYFTVNTVGYTATYLVKSSVSFKRNYTYTFNMPIDGYSTLSLYANYIPDPDEEVQEPEPEEPKFVTGTFTCATHNVDGMPNAIDYYIGKYELNADGPGADGTKTLSSKLAASGWDFVGFSEDFNYHDELTSAAKDVYTFLKTDNEKLPTSILGAIGGLHWKTDGLGFAGKTSTCSFVQKGNPIVFNSSFGNITKGANTVVDKGFRHLEVTLTNGTETDVDDITIDVIITHMNTYQGGSDDDKEKSMKAQHAQLQQIAEYINGIAAINKRPVIFMGDTNCRYTRHDFQTYFLDHFSSELTVSDPWIEYQWGGELPDTGGKSLMVSDATGTNDETDIMCPNTQMGEVVDKIIYINHLGGDTFIAAKSYLRDYDGYANQHLGDHYPIVVEFTYDKWFE